MIHIPKTSGSSFIHFYGLGDTTALGSTMKACETHIDSHWPRIAQVTDPRWVKFKNGECNFISTHDTLHHAIEAISAVKRVSPSIVFTSLRDPLERLISLYAFGCCTVHSCVGNGANKMCEEWVPEAIRKHGLKALVDDKLCPRRDCEWVVSLNSIPAYGNILTWAFQDYSGAEDKGKDESEKLPYLSGHSEEGVLSAKARIETLDVIMLTEYNEESVCLFYWIVGKKLVGEERSPFLKAFNEECRVDSTGFANRDSIKSRSRNLSPHGDRLGYDLQKGITRGMLNEISIYKHGVSIFCRQMQEMVVESGIGFPRINMLCAQY